MAQLDEKTKLLALAYLKTEKAPREVSDLLNISYASALKLKKELMKAETSGNLHTLFNLEEAALQTLLEKVQDDLSDSVELLAGDTTVLEGEVGRLGSSLVGASVLEKELQDAAVLITKQISIATLTVSSTDGLLTLAEALAKLHSSFFAKGANVQVNNINGSFEKYLQD